MIEVLGPVTLVAAMAVVGAWWWAVVQGRCALVTPTLVFLVYQGLYVTGVVLAVDWTRDVDQAYAYLSVAGLALVFVGAAVVNWSTGFQPAVETLAYQQRPAHDNLGRRQALPIAALILVSAVVALLFVRSIGFNTFQVAFANLTATGSADGFDFIALRKSTTQQAYVAAGYAVQFTGVILPAIALVLLLAGRQRRLLWLAGVGGALMALAVYSFTATGGRKTLLQLALAVVLLLAPRTSPFPRSQRPSRALVVGVAAATFAVYGFSTVLQGRLDAAGPTQSAAGAVSNAYNRLSGDFSANQILLVRALDDEAPVWGRQWADDLEVALPGRSEAVGITFGQRLHAILYGGNTRGNGALSLWSSLYYNWGPIGLLVFAFIIGGMLQWFTIFILRREKDLVAVVVLFMAGIRLAFTRDPYSLLLEGAGTLVLTFLVVRMGERLLTPSGAASTSGRAPRAAVR